MTWRVEQLVAPAGVSDPLAEQLVDCWCDVTNAGGVAGFPFPPVDRATVVARLQTLTAGLASATSRILLAYGVDGDVAGWLRLTAHTSPLVAHWGEVWHVQCRPELQGRGVGRALMHEARRVGRDEMGLEQLRLAVRDGLGLDAFYGKLGWRVVGRWPNALRLGQADDHDELLMLLAPL